ncbi:truncated FRIGIDA-like protein 1 [Macadamia integrifolia]|uniref:truncated FRIGIDA-like protein 1 n=1 Tax=Macadamia integrifolia TaxID=60698 RepID=UPI001C4EC34C|nr:truncated FRIGIDA-like protein 1 [Macadamia integrifolia]
MASLIAISSAIKSIDTKKDDLRKAFEDLQAHSSSLASFTLQWKDLEEHLDSIKSSIEKRFKELESTEPQAGDGKAVEESSPKKPESNRKQSSSAVVPLKKEEESEIIPRPELKSFCTKMDGKGLRSYVIDHRRELPVIRSEVAVAFKSAPDPAKLVLDAMEGFYPPNSKGDKDADLAAIRRTCILLLEQQTMISPEIKPQLKERATKLAIEWKTKLTPGGENHLEALAFLQLLATFDLVGAFSIDYLLDIFVTIARRRQAIDLCRALGFTENIPDFIQKLTSKGKLLEAVKFVFAFDLAHKFPPVPLLKNYIKESKKTAQEIRKKGNHSTQSQNEATARECAALKAVIKNIEEHHLASQYPPENLQKRMEQLEKQKAERKRPAAAPASKQQTGSKRSRPSAPAVAAPAASAAASSYPKTMSGTPTSLHSIAQMQQSGLLPERAAPYMGSAAGPYGLPGPSSIAHYGSSSSGLYGFADNPVNFGGNLSPARSHLYSSLPSHPSHPSQSSLPSHPSGLYDRSLSYDSYGLPSQYRPSSYYP